MYIVSRRIIRITDRNRQDGPNLAIRPGRSVGYTRQVNSRARARAMRHHVPFRDNEGKE